MHEHASQSAVISQEYTLIERAPCGCASSVMHNAQADPDKAARILIAAMQRGVRIECLPAQLASSIPWSCQDHQGSKQFNV